MFAETAFADYHLSLPFADKGKQSSVFHFCLQETNGKLSFVCYLYAAVSDEKRENRSPEAGFLVSTESGNRFLFTGSGYLFRIGDLETVTTFHKTRRKQDLSPLLKTGRKRDKLEKPGRKRGKRPKIPRIAGEQMPGRKHEETGK